MLKESKSDHHVGGEIYDSDEHECIQISCYRSENGGRLDEFHDHDGDRVSAEAVMTDIPYDDASVVAFVPLGCDPSYAARVFRKIADLYDGPHGLALTRLQRSEPINFAVRLADGNVGLFDLLEFASWIVNRDKRRGND